MCVPDETLSGRLYITFPFNNIGEKKQNLEEEQLKSQSWKPNRRAYFYNLAKGFALCGKYWVPRGLLEWLLWKGQALQWWQHHWDNIFKKAKQNPAQLQLEREVRMWEQQLHRHHGQWRRRRRGRRRERRRPRTEIPLQPMLSLIHI